MNSNQTLIREQTDDRPKVKKAERPKSWISAVQLWYDFERGTRSAGNVSPHGYNNGRPDAESEDDHAICWRIVEKVIGMFPEGFRTVADKLLIQVYNGEKDLSRWAPWQPTCRAILLELEILIQKEIESCKWRE